MKTVIRIYTPAQSEQASVPVKKQKLFAAATVCLIALNVFLGLCSDWVVDLIGTGLGMFV